MRLKFNEIAGTYQGQWLRGLRHGYGVRTSAPFGMASHNKLSETRMASMASLNHEAEAAAVPSALDETEANPDATVNNAKAIISHRGEEARGGFVLRSKSVEVPHRRRSLVERSGMKNLVQVW